MAPSTLTVFATAVFLVSITPGPNNLLAMTNGVRHGATPAIIAGSGRILAFAGMIALAALGLGAILAASETAFTVVKMVGAAYLVYLGLKLWRAPVADQAPGPGPAAPALGREGAWVLFRHEFMVAAGNPKAILMFTALFPQFLDPAQPAWSQFALMGAIYLPLEWLALAGYALGGRGVARFATSARGQRLVNRVSGSALLGAGVMLAVSRRG